MEIKKLESVLVVTSIQCDICGQSCEKGDCGAESARLEAEWGYDSNKDLEYHCCDMCENCYDKVRDFIENTLKGKVCVSDYRPSFGGGAKPPTFDFLMQDEKGALHQKSKNDIFIRGGKTYLRDDNEKV